MSWLTNVISRVFGGTSLPLADLDPAAEHRARLLRYRRNWKTYKSETLTGAVNEDGTPLTVVNLLSHNIDKVNYFAWGSGYTFTNAEYQEHLDAASDAWGTNKIERHLRMAQFGSVTGDAFLIAAPVVAGSTTFAFNEKAGRVEEKTPRDVVIVVVNSAYCLPEYDPFDMDKLVKMTMIIPMSVADETPGRLVEYSTQYSCYEITAKTIKSWMTEAPGADPVGEVEEIENPIGEVFAVHVRNYPLGDSIFGKDDIRDVERLNEEHSTNINKVGEIIAYHSDPITCIFGAKASNLKKGPNKIWGNLPKDGKVENLEMNTDLVAAGTHIDRLKDGIHVLTGVPEIAQGSKQSISNTSGVALHVMYQPLLEKAATKWITYVPKLLFLSVVVLKWRQALGNSYIVKDGKRTPVDGRASKLTGDDYQDILRDTIFKAEIPLPKDALIEVQIQQARVSAGLQTRRDALVALGEPRPDEKLAKIKDEKMEWGNMDLALAPKPAPKEASVESGAGAETGVHKTETDKQQGRPKGTTKE